MPISNISLSQMLADFPWLFTVVILLCSTRNTTRKSCNSSRKLDSEEKLLSTPPDLSTKAPIANGLLRKKFLQEGKTSFPSFFFKLIIFFQSSEKSRKCSKSREGRRFISEYNFRIVEKSTTRYPKSPPNALIPIFDPFFNLCFFAK